MPEALIHSAVVQQDYLCRVLGECRYGPGLDAELGTLVGGAGLLPEPAFSYVRYDAETHPTASPSSGWPTWTPSTSTRSTASSTSEMREFGRAVAPGSTRRTSTGSLAFVGRRRPGRWRGRRTRPARRRGRRGSRAHRGRRSAVSRMPGQWSRPSSTGWPGSPWYVARTRAPEPAPAAATRRTTSAVRSGRSTRVTRRPPRRVGQRPRARPAGTRHPPAQSSATTTETSRSVEQRPRPGGLGAEHHSHGLAAAVGEHAATEPQPGRAASSGPAPWARPSGCRRRRRAAGRAASPGEGRPPGRAARAAGSPETAEAADRHLPPGRGHEVLARPPRSRSVSSIACSRPAALSPRPVADVAGVPVWSRGSRCRRRRRSRCRRTPARGSRSISAFGDRALRRDARAGAASSVTVGSASAGRAGRLGVARRPSARPRRTPRRRR